MAIIFDIREMLADTPGEAILLFITVYVPFSHTLGSPPNREFSPDHFRTQRPL